MLLNIRSKSQYGLFYLYVQSSRRTISQPKTSEVLVDLLLSSSRPQTNIEAQPKFHKTNNKLHSKNTKPIQFVNINHRIHFPYLKYDTSYIKSTVDDIGKLYLTYYFVKCSINNNPGLSFSEYLDLSTKSTNSLEERFNLSENKQGLSVTEYFGYFVLNDIHQCHLFLDQILQDSGTDTKFSSYFNTIAPELNNKIDYHLIWNSIYNNSKYDLPKFQQPELDFNPLVLMSNINDIKSFLDSKNVKFKECNRALDVLYNFGRLSHEFHSALYLLKNYKRLNSHFLKVMKSFNSIMKDILKFNSILKLIDTYQVNDKNINRIFWQYVALLDLNLNVNSNSPLINWYENIINTLIHNPEFSFGYNSPSNRSLKFKKPNCLPYVKPLEISDSLKYKLFDNKSNRISFEEMNIFGNDFLNLTIYKYLITSGHTDSSSFQADLKRYRNIIQTHIEKSSKIRNLFPEEYLDQLTSTNYIGVFAMLDYNECGKFLSSFIDEEINGSYNYFIDTFKSLMFETNLPCLRLKKIPKNLGLNPFDLPSLIDYSNITRTMMINSSLIYPRNKNHWLSSYRLKHQLALLTNLGILNYKVSLKYKFFRNLSDYSIEYYPSIIKLLNSNHFFNYTLDQGNIFLLFTNNNYEKVLIDKRFNKKLIYQQYGQYMGILTINRQLESWVDKLSTFIIAMIENLDHIEVDNFLKNLNQKFLESNFAVNEMFKKKQLDYIQNNSDKFTLKKLNSNHHVHDINSFVGRQFLIYLVNKIHLNLSLDNFINSKKESMELLDEISDKLFLKESHKAINLAQYFGTCVLNSGLNEVEEYTESYIRKVLNCKNDKPDIIEKLALDIQIQPVDIQYGFSVWSSSVVKLPKKFPESHLHKLLLINYYVSRSYLNGNHRQITPDYHELPDICTKFNSMGNEFYKFSVIKCIFKSNIDFKPNILNELLGLFFDRKFKSIIAFNNRLYNPFGTSDYFDLVKKYIHNEYLFLRFGNQSLNQVIGSLRYHGIDIHFWITNLVNSLLKQLREKTPEQQLNLINQYKTAIEKEFKKVYAFF